MTLPEQLAAAGAAAAQAHADRRQAMAELADLIPKAADAGITVSEMARITGLTRITIRALRDNPGRATVREAASLLDCSVQHVHRLIGAGKLTVVHQLPTRSGAKLLDRAQLLEMAADRRAS